MKPRATAVCGIVAAFALFVACSGTPPQQPPIDTSGGATAASGGGSSIAGKSSDGGSLDGETVVGADDASDALSTCLSGGCLGCCTTANVCQPGNLTTACGTAGGSCTTCPSPETCISNFCQ